MTDFESFDLQQKVIVVILLMIVLAAIFGMVVFMVPAILTILYKELSSSLLSGMIKHGLLPKQLEWLDSLLVCLSALLLTRGWAFTWWITKKIFSSSSK